MIAKKKKKGYEFERRIDPGLTRSSSLMAAMLFWNFSRHQKVAIPSFVF